MRYYLDSHTLFIRGPFRAASTGISGGIRSVSTLLNHTVLPGPGRNDPEKELGMIVAAEGLGRDYLGLLTIVPAGQCCVFQYDFITLFITAGIRRETGAGAGGISIIICSSEGLSDAALLETIMVATEAKAEALAGADLPLTGTPADAIIVACEGEEKHRSAGRLTAAGSRVREAVLRGIPEALNRHDRGVQDTAPAFSIFSRLKEDHWIRWSPVDCPYYPCHFPGQSCDFCYCPFYPCHDEQLGQWVESVSRGKVWNCARCSLLHKPAVAAYLKKFPGTSREELVRLAGRNS